MTPSSSSPPSPTTISPRKSPVTSVEYAGFPGGQCRFILMNPNVKGHRCGCVAFSHNAAMPGAMCDCGHLSCFHSASPQTPPHDSTQSELQLLRRRLAAVEQRQQGQCDTPSTSNVEEMIQANSDELRVEMRELSRNVSGAWHLLVQMQKDVHRLDQAHKISLHSSGQVGRAMAEIHYIRDRQLEILDSDESLEARIEKLESRYTLPSPPLHDQTKVSNLESIQSAKIHHRTQMEKLSHLSHDAKRMSHDGSRHPTPFHQDAVCTITVSLLIHKNQDRPYRKDSRAYQRSLSRGLQRVVAVRVGDGASFTTMVSKVFEPILGTTPWTPLMIQSGKSDESSPIFLRPQKMSLGADWGFLADHCFTNDHCAYIAPWNEPLTWNYVRQLPIVVQGLEACWTHEPLLDANDKPSTSATHEDMEENTCCSRRRSTPLAHLKRSFAEVSKSDDLPIARGKVPRGFKLDVASNSGNIVAS